MSDMVSELKKLHTLQRDCGSLDDPYMLGLYNGLEMALALEEFREPKFLSLETDIDEPEDLPFTDEDPGKREELKNE